jgi:hypothetical protein
VDLHYETYFAGVRHFGMKNSGMINMINSMFIVLAETAIHNCLGVWKTGKYKTVAEFGPGAGAHREITFNPI